MTAVGLKHLGCSSADHFAAVREGGAFQRARLLKKDSLDRLPPGTGCNLPKKCFKVPLKANQQVEHPVKNEPPVGVKMTLPPLTSSPDKSTKPSEELLSWVVSRKLVQIKYEEDEERSAITQKGMRMLIHTRGCISLFLTQLVEMETRGTLVSQFFTEIHQITKKSERHNKSVALLLTTRTRRRREIFQRLKTNREDCLRQQRRLDIQSIEEKVTQNRGTSRQLRKKQIQLEEGLDRSGIESHRNVQYHNIISEFHSKLTNLYETMELKRLMPRLQESENRLRRGIIKLETTRRRCLREEKKTMIDKIQIGIKLEFENIFVHFKMRWSSLLRYSIRLRGRADRLELLTSRSKTTFLRSYLIPFIYQAKRRRAIRLKKTHRQVSEIQKSNEGKLTGRYWSLWDLWLYSIQKMKIQQQQCQSLTVLTSRRLLQTYLNKLSAYVRIVTWLRNLKFSTEKTLLRMYFKLLRKYNYASELRLKSNKLLLTSTKTHLSGRFITLRRAKWKLTPPDKKVFIVRKKFAIPLYAEWFDYLAAYGRRCAASRASIVLERRSKIIHLLRSWKKFSTWASRLQLCTMMWEKCLKIHLKMRYQKWKSVTKFNKKSILADDLCKKNRQITLKVQLFKLSLWTNLQQRTTQLLLQNETIFMKRVLVKFNQCIKHIRMRRRAQVLLVKSDQKHIAFRYKNFFRFMKVRQMTKQSIHFHLHSAHSRLYLNFITRTIRREQILTCDMAWRRYAY